MQRQAVLFGRVLGRVRGNVIFFLLHFYYILALLSILLCVIMLSSFNPVSKGQAPMSQSLSPSASYALSILGIRAVSCAFGLQLLASGAGRFARLAAARRFLLSCGFICFAPAHSCGLFGAFCARIPSFH